MFVELSSDCSNYNTRGLLWLGEHMSRQLRLRRHRTIIPSFSRTKGIGAYPIPPPPGGGGGSRKKSGLCSKTRDYVEIGDFAAAGENLGELAPN